MEASGRVAVVKCVPTPLNRSQAWMGAWAWSLRKAQPSSSLQGLGVRPDQSTLFVISPCHHDGNGMSAPLSLPRSHSCWRPECSVGKTLNDRHRVLIISPTRCAPFASLRSLHSTKHLYIFAYHVEIWIALQPPRQSPPQCKAKCKPNLLDTRIH